MSGIAGVFYFKPQAAVFLASKMADMLRLLRVGEQPETEAYSSHENFACCCSNDNSVATASLHQDEDFTICFNGRLNRCGGHDLYGEASRVSNAEFISRLLRENGQILANPTD